MPKNITSLLLFLAVVFIISGASSYITMPAVQGWYTTINKPSFNPPNWIFAPVWTILYIMIAISGWLVWKKLSGTFSQKLRSHAMRVYIEQLLANFLWSFIFFGMRLFELALIDIYIMLGLIALNIWHFKRISKPAAYLLVPYILWVAFASSLNLEIVMLN